MLDYQPEWKHATPSFLTQKGKVHSVIEVIKNKRIFIKEYVSLSTTDLFTDNFEAMHQLKLNKTLSLDCNMDFFWGS